MVFASWEEAAANGANSFHAGFRLIDLFHRFPCQRIGGGPGRFFRVKGQAFLPHPRAASRVIARRPGEHRSGRCFLVPW